MAGTNPAVVAVFARALTTFSQPGYTYTFVSARRRAFPDRPAVRKVPQLPHWSWDSNFLHLSCILCESTQKRTESAFGH